MCKFVERWMTPPGTSRRTAEANQASADAKAASDLAIAAQKQALDDAATKAAEGGASEAARLEAERRQKRLLQGGGFGAAAGPGVSGQASVAYKQLFGE